MRTQIQYWEDQHYVHLISHSPLLRTSYVSHDVKIHELSGAGNETMSRYVCMCFLLNHCRPHTTQMSLSVTLCNLNSTTRSVTVSLIINHQSMPGRHLALEEHQYTTVIVYTNRTREEHACLSERPVSLLQLAGLQKEALEN